VVRVKEISLAMQVPYPSTSGILKKMEAMGLVHHERYGYVKLSDDGRGTAGKILEREEKISAFLLEILDLPEYKVKLTMKISSKHISMDAPLVQDEDINFLDVFVSDNEPLTDSHLIEESLGKEIQRSLATLSKKERDIVSLFYGIGKSHSFTFEEIGYKFDLTRERVRQIKERAIRRLKHTSRSRLLKAYLGQ